MRTDCTNTHSRKRRAAASGPGTRGPLAPHILLFTAAALFALVSVPLWLIVRTGDSSISSALWHGHEMVFGFAFAVVAGFIATRLAPAGKWFLFVAWAVARFATMIEPTPLVLVAGLVFPVVVLITTIPALLPAVKRPENLVLPAILVALFLLDLVWWSGSVWFTLQVQMQSLLASIDILALLLLLVGGRALRAAVGGFLERQNLKRRDRTQGRYELPLAVLMSAAALGDLLGAHALAGLLSAGAALVTAARVIPWQLHRTFSQPQLWTLALGYSWLVAGLLLKGITQIFGTPPIHDMLHGFAIGALGTLTLVMMARTATLRAHRPFTGFRSIAIATILVSVAALLRLGVSLAPGAAYSLLWLAAIAWSSAFAILFVQLWRIALSAHPRRPM